MGTFVNPNCGNQLSRILRALVWGGLSVSVAAATIYDVGHWMRGW
ncbi:MAG: hypothetical protein ACXWKC_09210 [Xanthobacteraceae bacterium]